MKRLILLAVITLSVPVLAYGQGPGGHIGIYADVLGTNCYPQDVVPGVLEVFVLHTYTDGASAAEFLLQVSDDYDGVLLGEFLGDDVTAQIGNSYSGTAIGYGACREAPVHLLTLRYSIQGNSSDCSYFEIVGWAASVNPPGLNVVDCNAGLLPASGGKTYVNSNPNCGCVTPGLTTTPTRESTWGHIKALYGS